jgi:GNAT superfamily N-acetyltransferase
VSKTPEIQVARTDHEIRECSAVMRQLRPHIAEADFVQRVKTQQRAGYQLGYLADGGVVRCVAGFRIVENLASGRVLYVEDLVTGSECRSTGYGQRMLNWLVAQAKAAGCDTLELDSGVQRFGAHRFYLRNRLDIVSHHFRLNLK